MIKVGDEIEIISDGNIPDKSVQVGGIYSVQCVDPKDNDRIWIGSYGRGTTCPCGKHQWVFSAGDYKVRKTNKTMNQISNNQKNILDADTQALIKAGYLSSELSFTAKAINKINELTFFNLKKEIVKAAQEEIAEAEAKSKKD